MSSWAVAAPFLAHRSNEIHLYKSLTCLHEHGQATRCLEHVRTKTEVVTKSGSDVHLSNNQAITLAARLFTQITVLLGS
jgi:hypothetical protein